MLPRVFPLATKQYGNDQKDFARDASSSKKLKLDPIHFSVETSKVQGVCAILIFNKYTYFWQFAYLNLLSMWKYTYFQPKWMKRQKLGNIGEIGSILDGDTLIHTDTEKLFAIYEVSWYFNDFLLIFIHEIICSSA